MDDLDALLDEINQGDQGGDFAIPGQYKIAGEVEGMTDEELMQHNFRPVEHNVHQKVEGANEDSAFDGDPLLMAADGKPLSDDQLKLLYLISRYSHKEILQT